MMIWLLSAKIDADNRACEATSLITVSWTENEIE